MNTDRYPWILRMLHAVFGVCMLAQLAVGELMDVPEVEDEHDEATHWLAPAWAHENEHMAGMGSATPSLGFEVHEYLGLLIAGLLALRVMLAFTALPKAGWRSLFPWLHAEGRAQLMREASSQIKGWFCLKLAKPEDSEAISRTVHGLLLLLGSMMAITGVLLYLGWSTTEPQSWIIELVAEVHEAVVGVLIAMIGLHVLAAVLHEKQGHKVLARISPKP